MVSKPFSKEKETINPPTKLDSKQNPASLREVFRYVRQIDGSSPEQFEKKLLPYCGRYGKKKMPAKTIRQIEKDDTRIQYWHIELYSNYVGIPSGVLLLFSRLKANIRDGKHQNAIKIRESVREIFGSEKFFNDFESEDLELWIDAFSDKSGKLL